MVIIAGNSYEGDKMDKIKALKAVAIGLGGLAIGAAGATVLVEPQIKEVPVIEEKVVFVDKPVVTEKIVEVEKQIEVPVEVVTEVLVDNGNLDKVLDHIYDNDGQVEYLLEDLDDDELDLIVDRIQFVNEVKALAVKEAIKEGIDELDKEEIGAVTLDEDDIDRFRVYDDDEDIELTDIDFEDKDATVLVKAKFEQDDVKYVAYFEVEVKDGEVDDITVESIELR